MQAVVLAAGESSRFWPLSEGKHKSLISLIGKPLIAWTLEGLEQSGVTQAIVIQSPLGNVEKTLAEHQFKLSVDYITQKEPLGMGDALLLAANKFQDEFIVIHAHQFIAEDLIPNMLKLKQTSKVRAVLAGQETETPERYGIFALEGDRATGIVEKPSQESAPSNMRALGVYLLNTEFIDKLSQTPNEHYAFENALDSYMKRAHVGLYKHVGETISLKYPWDLFGASKILMDRHLNNLISEDADISPMAHISGDVHIEAGARIFEYAVVKGPCYIGENAVVGTHALVRDYSNLERGAVVGAHGEAARTIFQPGATTHSGFFGDSIFDSGAKIGAGTITANVKVHRDEINANVKGSRIRTGLRSFGVVVGAETQLGIAVNTMPGVLIGARTFVGPGAIVDSNVNSDSRLVVKQEHSIKEKRARNRERNAN